MEAEQGVVVDGLGLEARHSPHVTQEVDARPEPAGRQRMRRAEVIGE
jgi:hypothetical protein